MKDNLEYLKKKLVKNEYYTDVEDNSNKQEK